MHMFPGKFLRQKLFISNRIENFKYNLYWLYITLRIPFIQRKQKIRVLFVVQELGSWKTELLYRAMLEHPRFEPFIIVTEFKQQALEKGILIDYLKSKGYQYYDYDETPDAFELVNADYVYYYKPYEGMYPKGTYYNSHLKTIPCSVNYGFVITELPKHVYHPIHVYSYRFFVETKEAIASHKAQLGFKTHNMVVTGSPMQDILLQDKSLFDDPWKDKTGKKRIIFAPHHSIPGTNGDGVEYATILELGEYIKDLAQQYRDKITIAFKPHSALYPKLCKIWGEEKTKEYYSFWSQQENTQVELGDYVGLFKYSDAMIHDCNSFIVEYQFMDKPTLFLARDNGEYVASTLNKFGQDAFYCHVIAHKKQQIEQFVLDVINGVDEKKPMRDVLRNQYLLPPNGKTACENMMNEMLGIRQK